MRSAHSYNAGYHRGLNTEFHDKDIAVLFKEWVESKTFLNVATTFDPVAFEEGYKDAYLDYLNAAKELKLR